MHHDALIIGGSFAGLSAALMLARARRRVVVIDNGLPRNRFASHSHGVLGQDGIAGSELLANAKAQLLQYQSVRWVAATATAVETVAGGLQVHTDDGQVLAARKLLFASGITDVLPDIPGVAERWGSSVMHCPYCHGYEIGGGEIGVLATLPLAPHVATLLADWGDITLFNQGIEIEPEWLPKLQRRGVRIEHSPVVALHGDAPGLSAVQLADGRTVPLRALFVAPQQVMRHGLVEQFGCALEDSPVGVLIQVDAHRQTTVPGVYAAGDVTRMGNITLASAEGVMAGVGMHQALVAEDSAA